MPDDDLEKILAELKHAREQLAVSHDVDDDGDALAEVTKEQKELDSRLRGPLAQLEQIARANLH